MTSYGAELEKMGYKSGARNPAVEALDAEIVAGMRCKNRIRGKPCGGQLHYTPYHTSTSYVALTMCKQCGAEKEF